MANEKKKKITQVTLRDADGRAYVLGYTRNTVRAMEKAGFRLDLNYPYTMVTDLFRGAFRKGHYRLSNDEMDAIWEAQSKKQDLLEVLIQLYNAPMEELMGDKEDEDENPTWEAT